MAASRTGDIQNWRHPELEASTIGDSWGRRDPSLIRSPNTYFREFHWQKESYWSKIGIRNMCLIIIFRPKPYNERLPQSLKTPFSKWLRRKFPHLFDNYDKLSDRTSQTSPFDFGPTGLITLSNEVTTFTEDAQPNGSAPPYTTGTFSPKSN